MNWICEGLIPLFSTLFGGTIILCADFLRHKRTKKERYQQLLAEKTIEACGKLMRLLVELNANLAPITFGAEPLRWPKDKRISPNPSDQDNEQGKKVHKQLSDLNEFVETSQMILGPKVYRTWSFYWGTFQGLRIKIQSSNKDETFVCSALEDLMNEFIDKIGTSIQDELEGVGIDFVPTKEWRDLRHDGIKRADHLIDIARSRITNCAPKQ
ncbi:MAG: hypothetical protein WC484_07425 [Candidatus Omnitrophota bacterium]